MGEDDKEREDRRRRRTRRKKREKIGEGEEEKIIRCGCANTHYVNSQIGV